MNIAQELWDLAWKECLGDKDLTNARVGGRVSKDKPNKEDVAQWQKQGPEWVEKYIEWRKGNPEWQIWKTPTGVPAIELELRPVVAGVTIKMSIDRVFQVGNELVIVDLKTSQNVPPSALQLGFYKYGMESTFGIPVNFGTFFMARQSGTSDMIDLSWYTAEKLEYLVGQFDKARKASIFMPNADSCFMCGFSKVCEFSSTKGR